MMRHTVPTGSPPVAAARAGSGRAEGTSDARMAPAGPEPRSPASSTPRSAASRRALGEAGAGRALGPKGRWRADGERCGAPTLDVSSILDVSEHVGLFDSATGRPDLGEIDAVLLGELPGEWRGLDRRAGGARRRRGGHGGRGG